MWLLATWLAVSSAEAGFFYHDEYEPPSPRFGTFYLSEGLLFGGWGTNTLDEEPMYGASWSAFVEGAVMVLPSTKLALRGGLGSYGAKTSDGPNTAWVGFREQNAFIDALVEFEVPYLKVYAGPSLLGVGRVKAPLWQIDEPELNPVPFRPRNKGGVGGTYRHVAVGIVPKYLPTAKKAAGEPASGGGLQLEVRRTWMTTNQLVDYAPSAAAGWAVMGTVYIEIRDNSTKYDREQEDS